MKTRADIGVVALENIDELLEVVVKRTPLQRIRMRVLRRVRAETDGLFRGVFPISLTEALGAGNDRAKWDESGADDFLQELLEIVMAATEETAPEPEPEPAMQVMPRRVASSGGEGGRSRRPRDEVERPVA